MGSVKVNTKSPTAFKIVRPNKTFFKDYFNFETCSS